MGERGTEYLRAATRRDGVTGIREKEDVSLPYVVFSAHEAHRALKVHMKGGRNPGRRRLEEGTQSGAAEVWEPRGGRVRAVMHPP